MNAASTASIQNKTVPTLKWVKQIQFSVLDLFFFASATENTKPVTVCIR